MYKIYCFFEKTEFENIKIKTNQLNLLKIGIKSSENENIDHQSVVIFDL